MTLLVQLSLPPVKHLNELASALLGALSVERGEDLLSNTSSDVRNEEECISEGRGSELIVLRERSSIDIEALRARVRDHDVGDVGTGVVDRECDGHCLLREEGQEGAVGGVWITEDEVSFHSQTNCSKKAYRLRV